MSTNFAEQWLTQYKPQNNPVSYRAFDYEGIKRSLIEYLRVYHPEYFNNLIETDELLPLLELFAFVGDQFAYRADVNTQEHILANATRKSSALQLASMLGYTPSRRTPATGLMKVVSVSTTESVVDMVGTNLRGKVIRWNDSVDANWYSQFTRVLNRALNTQLGTVSSNDKISLSGSVVERYEMNTLNQVDGVYRYSVNINGSTLPLELVSAALDPGVVNEEAPSVPRPLSILSITDGFGTSSDGTGFFFLTKQGILNAQTLIFTGNTVNLTQEIATSGVNDTDVWLNEVDAAGNILRTWTRVENVAYNLEETPYTYQVETLEDDRIRLVFGDGTYGAIPNGTFVCWYRVSESFDGAIQPSQMQSQRMLFDYLDSVGNTQTLTIELSLVRSITNGSASETLERIKQAAPGVYYTQDRMVNGRDYHEFLLQDSSILKTKAVNRTFTGHSKYSGWFDGSETYSNVKVFGNDGALYFAPNERWVEVSNSTGSVPIPALIDQYVEPQLDYPDLWLGVAQRIGRQPSVRKYLLTAEKNALLTELTLLISGASVGMRWDEAALGWTIGTNIPNTDMTIQYLPGGLFGWVIKNATSLAIFESPTTRFWDYRVGALYDYDTVFPTRDKITVLQANTNKTRTGVLPANLEYSVVKNYISQTILPNQSLPDLSKVEVVGTDATGDGFPDDFASARLIGRVYDLLSTGTGLVTLPVGESYIVGKGDIQSIVKLDSTNVAWTEVGSGLSTTIQLTGVTTPTQVSVTVREYVYFERPLLDSEYKMTADTLEIRQRLVNDDPLVRRFPGRTNINFLWQHFSDVFDLVDPAKTNIVDVYLITREYYENLTNWVTYQDALAPPPLLPTYADLRLAYTKYLGKGMISDEIVLRSGRFKIVFGPKSRPELRAKIQLVVQTTVGSYQAIKSDVVKLIREYFTLDNQSFGKTMFFSDLSRYVSTNSTYQIYSMLLVPLYPGFEFGDLYQIGTSSDELLLPDISTSDIEIVENITSTNLRQ